jgi:hypothetical protein
MKKLVMGLVVSAAFAAGVACGVSRLAAPEVAAQAGAPEACVCNESRIGTGQVAHHCLCGNLDCAAYGAGSGAGISCVPRSQ